MLTGVCRQCEEMCSECGPRRLAGDAGDDLVGLAVECFNDPGAEEVLGRDVEPVGVALDGVEQSDSSVVQFRRSLVAEVGVSSRSRICCRVSVGVRGAMVSGRMMLCGSPLPTTWR